MNTNEKSIFFFAEESYFKLRNEIGFFLGIVGVQFATIIRNIFPFLELVNLFMAMSVILVINYKNLASLKLPCMSKKLMLIIILQALMIIYNILSPQINDLYLLYQSYVISFIFALSTQPKNKKLKYFDKIVFYGTFIISLVVVIQATANFSEFTLVNNHVFYKENYSDNGLAYGGDKITIGRALGLCIISVIIITPKFIWEKIVKILAVFFSLFGLIAFNTRAIFIGIVLYLFIKKVFYNSNNNYSAIIKNLLVFFSSFIILLLFVYLFIPIIQDLLNNTITTILRGIFTFIFGQSHLGLDESTFNRYKNILFIKELVLNSNFMELLFGHTNIKYLDIPIIQSFVDFGLIGAILYSYIMLFIPICFVFKYKNASPSIQILQLFALQYVIDQFFCADPYYFYHFMPIILICFFKTNNRRLFYEKNHL